jgi:hypothetical protein
MVLPELLVVLVADCALVAPLTAVAVSVVGVPPTADEDWVLPVTMWTLRRLRHFTRFTVS